MLQSSFASRKKSRHGQLCHGQRRLTTEQLEHRLLLTAIDIEYSSFLSGRSPGDIATDGSGNVYIAHSGDAGGQVTKFGPDGQHMWDLETPIDAFALFEMVVHDGSIYLTGQATESFETTTGAIQEDPGDNRDAFVAKLSAADGTLEYATRLGGGANEWSRGIAVDAFGAIYVTGDAGDRAPLFPVTEGAFQTTPHDSDEAFVAKLEPNDDPTDPDYDPDAGPFRLAYSTLLGGSASDRGRDIALANCDTDGANCAVYVVGATESADFPISDASLNVGGGYDVEHNGGEDAFIVKLDSTGGQLLAGTFLGGGGSDVSGDVAIDQFGNLYAVGRTASTDFPTFNALDNIFTSTALQGSSDAFVTKLDGTLSNPPQYSVFLGGDSSDVATDIVLGDTGRVYLVGETSSTDFPTFNEISDTDPNYDGGSRSGKSDAFIARIIESGETTVVNDSTYLGGSSDDTGLGIALHDDHVWVAGSTTSSNFPVSSNAFDNEKEGPGKNRDPFVAGLVLPVLTPPTASITVTPTSGLFTTESGGSDQFDVVLNTQPSADVTIGLSSSNIGEGTVSPVSITFGSSNWNTPQTVTVTGVDDGIADGDVSYTIVTSSAVSTDPDYNGLDPADVAVTNLDNNGTVSEMHVGDLDASATPANRGKWNATVTIEVHAADESVVADASVFGSWSDGASGLSTCVTDTSGTCSVTKNNIHKNNSSATFSVSDVTHAASSYAPSANHDPDGDSNGSSITIDQPAALNVAAGVSDQSARGENLTDELLGQTVAEAITLWKATGVPTQKLRVLDEIDIRLDELDGPVLAGASAGVVVIDNDAAGYGWSTDPATSGDRPLAGVDLLSAIVHEFGHVLGFDHDLMGATLGVGVRDLKFLDDVVASYGSWTGIRRTGDVNADGRFDQRDLIAVLQSGKYLSGQSADWTEGDWNGDGLFDQLDIVDVLQADTYNRLRDVDSLFTLLSQ